MSQVHAPSNLYVVRLAREATFGTNPGSTTRVHPLEGFSKKFEESQIKLKELQARLTQSPKNAKGPRRGTISVPLLIRPPAVQLDTSASSPSTPSPNGILLRTALGGWQAGQGSTVQASSTTTVVKVASGHGSRFWLGDCIAVEVAGNLEITFVQGISSDDVTVFPALSATPTTTGKVVNSHQFFWSNSSRESVSVEIAKASAVSGVSDFQWEATGCYAESLSLETKIEAELSFSVGLSASSFAGPEDLSQSLADEADTQGAAFVYMDSELWLSPVATLDRTHVTHHAFSLKANPGMVPIKDGGGLAKSNRAGAVRTGKPEASIDLELPGDISYLAHYDDQTDFSIVLIHKIGTGTSARHCVIAAHGAYLQAFTDDTEADNRIATPLSFSLRESSADFVDDDTDKGRSPFSIYLL